MLEIVGKSKGTSGQEWEEMFGTFACVTHGGEWAQSWSMAEWSKVVQHLTYLEVLC